jgi:hypothetical protein
MVEVTDSKVDEQEKEEEKPVEGMIDIKYETSEPVAEMIED